MILLIDTRMDLPDSDWVEEQCSQGFEVLHLPALEMQPIQTTIDWNGMEAAFLASPRAVVVAKESLKSFKGPLWAVGEGTAKALFKEGLPVAEVGDGTGALAFLKQLQSRYNEVFPVSSLAWISALETAVDLNMLALQFKLQIRHFPVYRTVFKSYDSSFMRSLSKPKKWLFYSGKALEALASFVSPEDEVVCIGQSAEQKQRELNLI